MLLSPPVDCCFSFFFFDAAAALAAALLAHAAVTLAALLPFVYYVITISVFCRCRGNCSLRWAHGDFDPLWHANVVAVTADCF